MAEVWNWAGGACARSREGRADGGAPRPRLRRGLQATQNCIDSPARAARLPPRHDWRAPAAAT
eukprot:3246893-Pyramimonas_sp.AAC.1